MNALGTARRKGCTMWGKNVWAMLGRAFTWQGTGARLAWVGALLLAAASQPAFAQSALSITKASNGPWTVGQPGTAYTLSVTNNGVSPTSGTITVRDQLPGGVGIRPITGFAPATGWTCSYSDEAQQAATTINPTTGMVVTCTSTSAVIAGGTEVLTIPVVVTSTAPASVTNYASIGGGGDPFNGGTAPTAGPTCVDPLHCASATTSVTALPAAPASCPAGTPANLLAASFSEGMFDNNATQTRNATLIATAGNYRLGTGPSGRYIVSMRWQWGPGYPAPSTASTQTLRVNGVDYANLITQTGFAGYGTVTALNGATLFSGTTTMETNRQSPENIWITLPAGVTTVSSVQIGFVSGNTSDDITYNVLNVLACPAPADLSITQTNTPVQGPNDLPGDQYVPGETRTYTVVVTNTSTTYTAQGVTVTDPIPPGVTGPVSWTCTPTSGGATCGTASGSGALVDPGLTLPPGAVATYTVTMTVPPGYTGGLTATATATPPVWIVDGTPANNTATDSDLGVTRVTINTVTQGGTGSFTFTGSNGVPNQTITTTVPGTPVSGTPQVLTTSGTVTTLTEGTPPTGYTLTGISCTGLNGGTATPDLATGTVTLDALATAAGANVVCTFTNTAIPGADLSIVKTGSAASVRAGGVVTFTLTGTNSGPGAANGAVIRDVPGTGLDCLTPSPTATCSASGGAACPAATVPVANLQGPGGVTIPTMPAGGGIVITLQCTVTATGLP
jgi:uncharacterized repeat protein (TIGR01451 family)